VSTSFVVTGANETGTTLDERPLPPPEHDAREARVVAMPTKRIGAKRIRHGTVEWSGARELFDLVMGTSPGAASQSRSRCELLPFESRNEPDRPLPALVARNRTVIARAGNRCLS
jgi:hypothetical protein